MELTLASSSPSSPSRSISSLRFCLLCSRSLKAFAPKAKIVKNLKIFILEFLCFLGDETGLVIRSYES